MSSDSLNALKTYRNYVGAYAAAIRHRQRARGPEWLLAGMEQRRAFSTLRPNKRLGEHGQRAFLRGSLTLGLMDRIDTSRDPDLAAEASFWLPVQGYYAVHGFGLAVVDAREDGNLPTRHSRFLNVITGIICTYFPGVLAATCAGGPEDENIRVAELSLGVQSIRNTNNLTTPDQAFYLPLIGKALLTTHDLRLEANFAEARKTPRKNSRATRRNLSAEEKQEIADRIGKTGVARFLYRLRAKSNYEDPEIFLQGHESAQDYLQYYEDLVLLVQETCRGLRAVLVRLVGEERVQALEQRR